MAKYMTQRYATAKHHKVDQGVGTETVGAMHGHTGRFANSHQAWHHGVRIAILLGQHFTVIISRDAAHIVVNGWQHRDRLFRDVDACEDFRLHVGAPPCRD